MILADTSIWIDHFRSSNQRLVDLLIEDEIVMHPYVIAELALGSMHERSRTLSYLESLPRVQVALQSEVRQMIEGRSLHGQGVGLVDAHLMASALIHAPTRLWTLDKRLRKVVARAGIDVIVS